MALAIGTQAPDITLTDHLGQPWRLTDYRGQPVVLFFYPKAESRVCTAEACSFRDGYGDLQDRGIVLAGISRDKVETQARFAARQSLPYPLLSDPDGRVCRAYQALMPLLGVPLRVTYLLDRQHKVAHAYSGLFEASAHLDAVVEASRKLK